MCTIIVTIRSVLWAVMTIAGSLMILVSLFTNRWLIGGFQVPSSANSFANSFNSALDKFGDIASGRPIDDKVAVGIFLDCVKPEGSLVSVSVDITLFSLSFISDFRGRVYSPPGRAGQADQERGRQRVSSRVEGRHRVLHPGAGHHDPHRAAGPPHPLLQILHVLLSLYGEKKIKYPSTLPFK